MAISIDFLANERDLVRGASNAADALEKVSDSLDDVARDSQRSAGKMETEYRDAARGVDQSNERLERSFRELAQASKQQTSKLGDELGSSTRRGTEEAGRSVEEFSSEAKQNIAETFSSFRGDATDFAQIAQDTLGGLVSGLDGIPAVAAVAAGAAGLGLILGAIETGQVKSEEWREEVSQLAQSLIDTGKDGAPAIDRIVDALKVLATATDDTNLKKLSDLADQAGVSFKQLGATWGGSSDDLRALWREADKNNEAIWESIRAAQARGDANLEEKYRGEARAALELRQEIGKQIGVTAEAEAQYEAYVAAGGPELQAKAEATQSYADSVASALHDAGSAWEDYNQDGITSLEEYNQHIEAQVQAIQQYQENMVSASATLSQEALNYIQSLGQDAAPILQAYVDAPLAQQQRTAANWAALGRAASANYTGTLKAGIPTSVPGTEIVARWRVDDSALRAAIRAQQGVTIGVNLVDARTGRRAW